MMESTTYQHQIPATFARNHYGKHYLSWSTHPFTMVFAWFSHGFPMAEVNTPLVILFLNEQVSNPLDEKTQMKAAPPTGYSNSAQSPGLAE